MRKCAVEGMATLRGRARRRVSARTETGDTLGAGGNVSQSVWRRA